MSDTTETLTVEIRKLTPADQLRLAARLLDAKRLTLAQTIVRNVADDLAFLAIKGNMSR